MLSSFAPWCAETCISASERESQKPHQGFAGQNLIPHRGIAWSKSTLALGLPEWAGKTASGPAVAANNWPTISAAPSQPPPLKPGCTKAGLWAGLKAAGQDLIPIPPQFNPDPVGATGDFLTSKQGQAATVGVLYEVASGARYLAPFADTAADFVPIAGQLWLAYQVGHALYEGGVAYKQAIDQCYGGG